MQVGIMSQTKNRFVTPLGVFCIDHYTDTKDATPKEVYTIKVRTNGIDALLGRFDSWEAARVELARMAHDMSVEGLRVIETA